MTFQKEIAFQKQSLSQLPYLMIKKKNSSPDFEARITEGGEFSEFTAVPSPWRGQWSLTWGKLLTYLSFSVGICCGNDDSPTSES